MTRVKLEAYSPSDIDVNPLMVPDIPRPRAQAAPLHPLATQTHAARVADIRNPGSGFRRCYVAQDHDVTWPRITILRGPGSRCYVAKGHDNNFRYIDIKAWISKMDQPRVYWIPKGTAQLNFS
eukprot:65225-Amorphochlora_amoeboformis.AAC.1